MPKVLPEPKATPIDWASVFGQDPGSNYGDPYDMMMGTWNTGGKVPGVKGAPQLGVIHGGETVLPPHLGKWEMDSTKGGSALQRQLGGLANGAGTVNMMNKPTTINIYTSENAAATIDNIERMQLMDEASFFTSI